MSGTAVVITAHQGCDVRTSCTVCGGELYLKQRQPALYLARTDKLACVCFDCAKNEDPDTVALFKPVDSTSVGVHEDWAVALPVSIVVVVTGPDDVRLFSTGDRESVADLAAEALASRTAAGRLLLGAAEAAIPKTLDGFIATAQAVADYSALGSCVDADDRPLPCASSGDCGSCLTLHNLAEMSERKCGSADPYPLSDTRTPLPDGGRYW